MVDPDPDWPQEYDGLAGRIRDASAGGCCSLSTWAPLSVAGLPVEPIIDIDLTVADPGCEQDYIPALEAIGVPAHSQGTVVRPLDAAGRSAALQSACLRLRTAPNP